MPLSPDAERKSFCADRHLSKFVEGFRRAVTMGYESAETGLGRREAPAVTGRASRSRVPFGCWAQT